MPLKSIGAQVKCRWATRWQKKHLKLQWDIKDADEVQEITADRTPMKKYAWVCDMQLFIGISKLVKTNFSKKNLLSSGEIIWSTFSEKRKEINNHMFDACKPIGSECTSKYEFKNYNRNIVVEKEEQIMKKCVENREIMRE